MSTFRDIQILPCEG